MFSISFSLYIPFEHGKKNMAFFTFALCCHYQILYDDYSFPNSLSIVSYKSAHLAIYEISNLLLRVENSLFPFEKLLIHASHLFSPSGWWWFASPNPTFYYKYKNIYFFFSIWIVCCKNNITPSIRPFY